ncbi:MAG: hypothetical protein AMJ46_08390 [Latescibacteria bacterium DG_63]|nr:MAG: hypothetical protein AMJ46_08390 [Latescibacteria bacterium DG_63]
MRHCAASYGFLAVLVLGIMLAGCSSPTTPRREPQGAEYGLLERTSPENVLTNLRIIYGDVDSLVVKAEDAHYWAERYEELFHPDSSVFKFHFVIGEEPPGTPDPWWGIRDEVASFDNLLSAVASGLVEDVRLDWFLHPCEPDDRVDPDSGELLHPDWEWIRVSSILLDVDFGDMIYRVTNGLADFYLSSDPADSTLWVVAEWFDKGVLYCEDRTSKSAFGNVINGTNARDLSATGEPTTWGRIKGLFM